MGIQNEIKQSRFRNERQKGAINIIFTYNWMVTRIKAYLKPYGITMQQFNVLRILNGQYPNPITTYLIRERMLNRMSDASRIVERLHRKGLVARYPCLTDRRLVDVLITEEGQTLIQRIDERATEIDDLLQNISQEEANLLNELLDRIRG